MKERRFAGYVLMTLLALLGIFVAMFIVFLIDYLIENSEIQEILNKVNDPKQERVGRLELREWVEAHPYDSRIMDLALTEEDVDKQYCVDVIARYLEGNPDDFDTRLLMLGCLNDPKEKLVHVDYVLRHASPEKYKDYSFFLSAKNRYLAQIANEATQELSVEQIESGTGTGGPVQSE